MFESNLRIYGKHAAILKKYSQDKQAEEQFEFKVLDNDGNSHVIYIFDTMIQAYMVASMIGIIHNEKIDKDEGKEPTATIFSEVLTTNRKSLQRIVKFMILTEKEYDDVDPIIKEAFSINYRENIEKEITSYARYGFEVIDNYFKDCVTYEDVINAIVNFKNDYSI